jgi:hypothetical protein
MTVLPTIVPPQQRGAYAGYQQLCDSISWATGSGLGIAIGQGLISDGAAYTIFVVLNLLQRPYGVAAMGSRPGWWYSSPEVRPPIISQQEVASSSSSSSSTPAPAGLDQGNDHDEQLLKLSGVSAAAHSPSASSLRRKRPPRHRVAACGKRLRAGVLEFFSAWRSRAFAMLWVYLFTLYVASVTAGTWSFYFYSDVLCNAATQGGACRYELFGHHITSSTQTAISIVGVIGRVASFITAVPGGYLGDRLGRLNVVRWIQVGGLVLPYLIMANTSSWTVVLGEFLLSIWRID